MQLLNCCLSYFLKHIGHVLKKVSKQTHFYVDKIFFFFFFSNLLSIQIDSAFHVTCENDFFFCSCDIQIAVRLVNVASCWFSYESRQVTSEGSLCLWVGDIFTDIRKSHKCSAEVFMDAMVPCSSLKAQLILQRCFSSVENSGELHTVGCKMPMYLAHQVLEQTLCVNAI